MHDAEDVTAAAFFELWRKRRAVRLVEGSVLPWLLVATVNLSMRRVVIVGAICGYIAAFVFLGVPGLKDPWRPIRRVGPWSP